MLHQMLVFVIAILFSGETVQVHSGETVKTLQIFLESPYNVHFHFQFHLNLHMQIH